MFESALMGLQAITDPSILIATTVGVVAGIIAGLIPGFTILMGVILVLPFTYGMPALQGIATMMGVFVGGNSGGLISACLIGIPGTPSSVATTFDGFPMARNGEPGRALGLGTWASFFGSLIGWVLMVTVTPTLADFGLKFGPWEFFSLIAFALTIIASLSGKSLVKGLIAGLLGMLLATVGVDPMLSIPRFTMGNTNVESGFDFLPMLIGLFAFSQLMKDLEVTDLAGKMERVLVKDITVPTLRILKDIWHSKIGMIWAILVGVWIGIVPAAGGSIANVLAYDQMKRLSKNKDKYGTGYHEGIIASEAGNNACSAGACIPMLALGIPGDAVTAVMLGALLIQGLQPGPMLMSTQPKLAYGAIMAYLAATILMLLIQANGMKLFARLVLVPKEVLVPGILVMCTMGAFVLNNRIFDMWVMFFFGLVGYLMRKMDYPPAPMVLALVLGPMVEMSLRQSLTISHGSLTIFFTRPISATLTVIALVSLFAPLFRILWTRYRAGKTAV